MSWMSQLVTAIRGTSPLAGSPDVVTRRVIEGVEPEIWGLVQERQVPLRSFAEARGYLWARSALLVTNLLRELEPGLAENTRARIVAEARLVIADRIIVRLRMQQDGWQGRRAA